MAGHAIAGWPCVTDGYGASYSRKYSDTLLKSFMGKKTLASLPKFILVALVLLNYPHLLYLGFIHQRGPIVVNQYLAAEINREARPGNPNNNSQKSQPYTIHFLMGCHSAPLYSHLHIPNARLDAWHLDCSPSWCLTSEASDTQLNLCLGIATTTSIHHIMMLSPYYHSLMFTLITWKSSVEASD